MRTSTKVTISSKKAMPLSMRNILPIPYEPLTIHKIPTNGDTRLASTYGNCSLTDHTQASKHWNNITTVTANFMRSLSRDNLRWVMMKYRTKFENLTMFWIISLLFFYYYYGWISSSIKGSSIFWSSSEPTIEALVQFFLNCAIVVFLFLIFFTY